LSLYLCCVDLLYHYFLQLSLNQKEFNFLLDWDHLVFNLRLRRNKYCLVMEKRKLMLEPCASKVAPFMSRISNTYIVDWTLNFGTWTGTGNKILNFVVWIFIVTFASLLMMYLVLEFVYDVGGNLVVVTNKYVFWNIWNCITN
jgi:hypothetical protein